MRKIVRISGGFALMGVGLILALPLVPGPGLPLMVLGLAILADHFHWAKRIMDWGKRKVNGMRPSEKP